MEPGHLRPLAPAVENQDMTPRLPWGRSTLNTQHRVWACGPAQGVSGGVPGHSSQHRAHRMAGMHLPPWAARLARPALHSPLPVCLSPVWPVLPWPGIHGSHGGHALLQSTSPHRSITWGCTWFVFRAGSTTGSPHPGAPGQQGGHGAPALWRRRTLCIGHGQGLPRVHRPRMVEPERLDKCLTRGQCPALCREGSGRRP